MIDAVIGQDQGNRRKGTRPNQGLEPPLLWSVEFMKKVVHVESNDTEPLGFLWWRLRPTGHAWQWQALANNLARLTLAEVRAHRAYSMPRRSRRSVPMPGDPTSASVGAPLFGYAPSLRPWEDRRVSGHLEQPFRQCFAQTSDPIFGAWVGLRRAAGLYTLLNWGTGYRTIGTENAAASRKRPKCHAAAFAVAESYAGIGRHGFSRLMPTMRTG